MIRTNIAFVEIGVDYSNYDDMFLTVIDALIYMQFGNEAAELISFYLFDRINPDGTINPIIDQDDVEIEIKDATHLWEIISRFDPKL
jgi:hypothetical protein